jgi:DNA polymerase I-like protein with 3'-5' exonuclease and polymerase domains
MPYETDEQRFKRLDGMRQGAKVVNYSALYGVGSKKLSRESGMSQKEATDLLDAFWKLNWSIQKVAGDSYTKTLKEGSEWIKNPVSGFYYNLRNERDKWSTLNQGTGVFVFDSWVMRMLRKGVVPNLQYHDEVLVSVPKGTEQEVERKLKEAMQEVNESLKLNVSIEVDVQFGNSYAGVH